MVKTESQKISDRAKKARYIIAEINDSLSKMVQWLHEAHQTLDGLHRKWHELMQKSEEPVSKNYIEGTREFVGGCDKLLDECTSFQRLLYKKIHSFTKDTEEKVSAISKLAGDDKETMSILDEVLNLWDNTVGPGIRFQYDNTAGLTSSIIDMMKFMVEPVETDTQHQRHHKHHKYHKQADSKSGQAQ